MNLNDLRAFALWIACAALGFNAVLILAYIILVASGCVEPAKGTP